MPGVTQQTVHQVPLSALTALTPPQHAPTISAVAAAPLPFLDSAAGIHLIDAPSLYALGQTSSADTPTYLPLWKQYRSRPPKVVNAVRSLAQAVAYFQTQQPTPTPFTPSPSDNFFRPFLEALFEMPGELEEQEQVVQEKLRVRDITAIYEAWQKAKKAKGLSDQQLKLAADTVYGEHYRQGGGSA